MRGGPKGNIGYGNGGGDGSPNGKSSPVLMQLSPRVSGKNWQVNKEPNRAGRVLSAVKEYRGGAMRSNVRRLSFRLLCLRSVHDDLMKKMTEVENLRKQVQRKEQERDARAAHARSRTKKLSRTCRHQVRTTA